MIEDYINYPELIDGAMRGAVRDVLRQVCQQGLPGDHHFYITFRTDYSGVRISEALQARYPHEMTIVLQHQFWDFKVEEQSFTVTLSFGGVPERLIIPFAALTAFADPSVKFGLQFQGAEVWESMEEIGGGASVTMPVSGELDLGGNAAASAEPSSAEIISLDSFRTKK